MTCVRACLADDGDDDDVDDDAIDGVHNIMHTPHAHCSCKAYRVRMQSRTHKSEFIEWPT